MRNLRLVLGIILCLFITISFAQENNQFIKESKKYGCPRYKSNDDNLKLFDQYGLNKEAKQKKINEYFIVKFSGKPQCLVPNSLKESHLRLYSETFERFVKNVKEINLSNKDEGEIVVIENMKNAFFGSYIKCNDQMAKHLKQLSYIEAVTPVVEVKLNLETTVGIIGADQVWADLGITGKGIRVGVIDTGIEEDHECFLDENGDSRVIGGEDMIHFTGEIFDDHGHGTHCAGIIGGNSETIIGVAPDVSFYSYKVIESTGHGHTGRILVAVNRCMDPNEDDNFDDKLDIVSMSIGYGAQENDPIVEAINNASEAGITFCIAAGNSYRINTVGAPGIAENAITVGASDNNDELADFSSKGPAYNTVNVKPDVIAPGVEINSAFLNNSYISWSGTSMATPHVAGVCALIKEKYPDWTYKQIKSALMTTATSIGLDAYHQGAGRVNALDAISLQTFAYPSLVNFGTIPLNDSKVILYDSICVVNNDTISQTYDVIVNNKGNDYAINCDLDEFALEPNDSIQLLFSLAITDLDVSNETSIYDKFSIASLKDTLSIAFSATYFKIIPVVVKDFGNLSSVTLTVNISDRIHKSAPYSLDQDENVIDVLAYSDQMNLYFHASYGDDYYIAAKTILSDQINDSIIFSGNEINNKVDFVFKDKEQQPLDIGNITIDLKSLDHNMPMNYGGHYIDRNFYFPDLESYQSISAEIYSRKSDTSIYYSAIHLENINGDTTVFNDESSYFKKIVKTFLPTNKNWSSGSFTAGFYMFMLGEGSQYINQNKTWSGNFYIDPSYNFKSYYGTSMNWDDYIYSPPLYFESDKIELASYKNLVVPTSGASLFSTVDTYTALGDEPYLLNEVPSIGVPYIYAYENSDSAAIWSIVSPLGGSMYYMNGTKAERILKLYDENNELISSSNTPYYENLTKGIYTINLEIEDEGFSISPTLSSSITIDTRKEDYVAPFVNTFQVRNENNVPTYEFVNQEDIYVHISIADLDYSKDDVPILPVDLSLTQLKYKSNQTDNWIDLDCEFIALDTISGYYFVAQIPSFNNIDYSFYDVALQTADMEGNLLEMKIEKAFLVLTPTESKPNPDTYSIENDGNWYVANSVIENDVLSNSIIPDVPVLINSANHGILNFKTDGTFIYKPENEFYGVDTFTYCLQTKNSLTDTVNVILNITNPNTIYYEKDNPFNLQYYPSPVRDECTIQLELDREQEVKISLIDISGSKKELIHNSLLPSGENKLKFNMSSVFGGNLKSGIYLLKIETTERIQLGKIMYLNR